MSEEPKRAEGKFNASSEFRREQRDESYRLPGPEEGKTWCYYCEQPIKDGDQFYASGNFVWHRLCGPTRPEDETNVAAYWMARAREYNAQLAEALSQRQAAVEEAEREATRRVLAEREVWLEMTDRLERELAAANQDARDIAGGLAEMLNQYGDEGPEVGWQKRMHEFVRSLLAAHTARLASQPPAEAEGA